MSAVVRRDDATHASRCGWLAVDVDQVSGATVLRGHNGDVVRMCVVPETEAARRMAPAFRRVHRIEIMISDGIARAAIVGVGHRLPVRRAVPVAVALGFAVAGHPTFVQSGPALEGERPDR